MKVLHVIPSLSLSEGGPSVAMPFIARSLMKEGIGVDVATTNDDGPGRRTEVVLGEPVDRAGVSVRFFQKQTQFYKVSLPFSRWVKEHVRDYDLVHIHALFSFTSVSGAWHARRAGVPYVVRPIGVLNRWGMRNRRRWIKALSFRLVEGPILRHAAAMHYTSRQEQAEAEQAGASAPPAVIPLGVEVPAVPEAGAVESFWMRFPGTRGRKLVLFLSRLHEKKGLDLLLPAFAGIHEAHPDAVLVLAGDGERAFVESLRQKAAELGIADAVVWTGFLGGEKKAAALAAATVFALPSYSENFGIALVEALAAGLPVVTTPGVALAEDVREGDAGLVVPPEVEPLRAALDALLRDAALRQRMGAQGRRLAIERFSLDAMGAALRQLYSQILAARAAH